MATAAAAGFGGSGGGGFRGADRGAFAKCLPARLRRLRTQFTTPQQTLRQVLDPPQTNIKTSAYTIGGVDQTHPTNGLVTTAQVTKGRYLDPKAAARRSSRPTYAAQARAEGRLEARPERHAVHGRRPRHPAARRADRRRLPPLQQLQTLANQKDLANVVLVRADSSSTVGAVQKAIETALPNAQVASSKQVADTISGSLVDASNLSHDLGFALSALAAVAAFLLAALLALSSVGKRVRELGHAQGARLDAAAWSCARSPASRSRRACSAASSASGSASLVALARRRIRADAHRAARRPAASGLLRPRQATARTATSAVSLDAPLGVAVLALGFALALLGGLIAGTAGALRAARLRPADALRQVE